MSMIYGTAWKKEQTDTLVSLAIENGFRAIDTACQPKHYNEKLVGDGIKNALEKNNLKREDLFIQTKFTPIDGQDINNIPYNPNDSLEDQINTSISVSLENLQTTHIDSLLLHSPLFPFSELSKAWSVFEEFYNQGIIKQIGISNCYNLAVFKKLYDDATIKPKVLQNRFYAQSGHDKELRKFCIEHDVSYQSFWSLTANPEILNSQLLYELSLKYQKTQIQIFYRYLTQINITPLNGTTSSEHMQEDLSIFDFELDIVDIDSINSLL